MQPVDAALAMNGKLCSTMRRFFQQTKLGDILPDFMSFYSQITNILVPECSYKNLAIDFVAHTMEMWSTAEEKRRLRRLNLLSRESRNVSALQKVVTPMEMVANKREITHTEYELSKAYLQRLLTCKDGDYHSTYCLTNVYLAV